MVVLALSGGDLPLDYSSISSEPSSTGAIRDTFRTVRWGDLSF